MKKFTPLILLAVLLLNFAGGIILFYSEHSENLYSQKNIKYEQSLENILFSLNEAEDNNSGNDNPDSSLFSFSFIIQHQNNLVKSSIYLASIQDFAPSLQSQFIAPNTLPPKAALFA